MTRQNPLCDRYMTSSPDGAVVRSSTEDHVVELPRDMPVADHHTPNPVDGWGSSVLQDRMDAEPSVQNRYLQNNNNLLVKDQSSRVRPMSSRIYNPLPFKKRFQSVPQVEDLAPVPREVVSSPIRQSIGNPQSSNHVSSTLVSSTSPKLFSPFPYSRHCNSYSPVNWQNPSVNRSPTELETEEEQINFDQTSIVEPVCLDNGKSSNKQNIKANEYQEVISSTDNQFTTEGKSLGEEMVIDLQILCEEPLDVEADAGHNPRERSSSEEWLIDQYSPIETRSLIDEWTKKRSEDYQNSLQRPLTTIPEEDGDSFKKSRSLSKVNAFNDTLENITNSDIIELVNERKSPLRDSLEEFVLLEKYFVEEETRSQEKLISMKPNEKSECSGSTECDKEVGKPNNYSAKMMKHVKEKPTNDKKTKKSAVLKENNKTTDDVSSQFPIEQIADDCVNYEVASKSPLRDSLEEFIQLEKYFIEEENRRNKQLIEMKPSEEPDVSAVSKCDTEVKKPNIITKVINQFKAKRQTKAKKRTEEAVENKKVEESKEMKDLTWAFEERLKEKHEFEKLIQKQEREIKGQLRKMDEVMEDVQSEHADLEKVTKDFVDSMKVHLNNKNEVARTRVQIPQREISLSILHTENSDLENDLRELYDNTEDIQERRSLGLEELKHKIEDVKREAELLKKENNELENGTKKKVTEFNELRMTVMGKGITYVRKGTIVKGTGSVRFPIKVACKSSSPKALSKGLLEDIPNIDNVPPDLKAPRVYPSDICSFDKSSNYGSHRKFDGCGRLVKPIRPMSALELVRLPGARKERTKIPKPTYELYGISTRDSERYTVSDEDPYRMVQNKDYNRDNFVKEDERDAFKLTFDYITREMEYQRVSQYNPKSNFDRSGRSQYAYWSKYNASLDKNRNEMDRNNTLDARQKIRTLQKQAIVPKRGIKKEIKSKIDTGLRNRPVNQKRSISSNKKNAMKTNAPARSGTAKSMRREVSSSKGKTRSLPPLKKGHNGSDIPRSPAFGNKAPLPGIQPSKQQLVNKAPLPLIQPSKQRANKTVSDKRAVTHQVLPPIKSLNAGRLPAIVKDNKQSKVSSKKQAPTAMWISFSPTPPPTPPTNRARSARRRKTPDTGRSSQDDGKRVLHGRA